MNRPSEPFNAEERDLAQRLARLGGPREPAPALDAIILAAARAAVSESAPVPAPASDPSTDATADPKVTPLRPRKPTPRWPLGMGLAASLVLAAGIGWRLQGDGEGSSADAVTTSASAPAAEESVPAVILEPPMERTPPPPPPPMGGAADAVARRADIAQAPLAKTAPSKPEFVADAPMAEPLAQAPAAPPPPAPVAAASSNAVAADSDAALDSISATGSRVGAEREVGAAEYTRTPLEERRQQATSQPASKATAAGAAAAPAASMQSERARGFASDTVTDGKERKERDSDKYDDRPPVSADSPEFRQAWLQRIRGHIAKGESDAARSSLQEFRRRYPDVELPEDLRKLAATLPTP